MPTIPFNPLDYPLCLELPRHVNAISWQEHIPFAMALVQMVRPRVLVELGVHTGDSYLAFCQAVAELGLDTSCYGVDTWRGDEHAGFFGDEVLAELRLHHDARYGTFSRLVQSTFDDAARHLPDGSVSLLHIDGLHTYEAVKHDWETWRPKLSSSGVVLFHDVNVRERNFGVWRLWDEIKGGRPYFEFKHGHGLGVLAGGDDVPLAMKELVDLRGDAAESVRAFFFAMGSRITLQAQNATQVRSTQELQRKVLEYDGECRLRDARIRDQEAKILQYDGEFRLRDARIRDQETKILEYDSAARDRDSTIRRLSEERARLDAELNELKLELARSRSRFRRAITAPWRLLRGSRP